MSTVEKIAFWVEGQRWLLDPKVGLQWEELRSLGGLIGVCQRLYYTKQPPLLMLAPGLPPFLRWRERRETLEREQLVRLTQGGATRKLLEVGSRDRSSICLHGSQFPALVPSWRLELGLGCGCRWHAFASDCVLEALGLKKSSFLKLATNLKQVSENYLFESGALTTGTTAWMNICGQLHWAVSISSCLDLLNYIFLRLLDSPFFSYSTFKTPRGNKYELDCKLHLGALFLNHGTNYLML